LIRIRRRREYPVVPVRSLGFAGIVLVVIAGFLAIDRVGAVEVQLVLGAATWAVLIWACAGLEPEERARVALVVIVATCAEILGSIVLGVYEYRLANLPAFVPPGHGLVYLGGLAISRWVIDNGHRRAFIAGVIAFVAGWGALGLVALGRTDLAGALAGALLVYCLLRGRAPELYGGVFLIVAFLEIYGTAVGAWSWATQVPLIGIPAGNPPSGIASIYVLFDIAAIALAPRLLAALRALPRLRDPAELPVPGS
jgi:hypothetical protein